MCECQRLHLYIVKIAFHKVTEIFNQEINPRSPTRLSNLRFVYVCVLQCKLDYQACISGKQISVKCSGQCPCPSGSPVEKKGTVQTLLMQFISISPSKVLHIQCRHTLALSGNKYYININSILCAVYNVYSIF